MASVVLTEKEQSELAFLARWKPWAIVYGAKHPQTGEWQMGAVNTMAKPNRLAREGWHVVRVQR